VSRDRVIPLVSHEDGIRVSITAIRGTIPVIVQSKQIKHTIGEMNQESHEGHRDHSQVIPLDFGENRQEIP